MNNIASCAIWSLTLRQESKLSVSLFKIKILSELEPKRDENGEWKDSTMRN